MKQLIAIALTLIMVCSLCACGRKPAETNPTTIPATTAATTAATTTPTTAATMPTIDTTLETNIPDPSVDTSMPDATDLLPTDEATGESTGSAGTGAKMK